MLPIGMVVITAGYLLVFYGERLWVRRPVTMSYALGLSATNTAPQPAAANPDPSSVTLPGSPGGDRSGPATKGTPSTPGARSVPAGPGPAPIVAPPG